MLGALHFLLLKPTRMGAFFIPPLSYLRNCIKSALNLCGLLQRNRKVFIFGGVIAFSNIYAQVTMDASGGTTGGAITDSPISNSVSSVGNITTGASTSAGGNASSSGNTSGNTAVNSNYTTQKIPVSTAYAPTNFPTAPCMGASSIGGSTVLFGFSAGSSWEATECMTFEAARSFDQAGMHEDALAIKCTSKYSAAAPSCIELLAKKAKSGQAKTDVVNEEILGPDKEGAKKIDADPVKMNVAKGMYIEIVDPSDGFITIIDTRDSYDPPVAQR